MTRWLILAYAILSEVAGSLSLKAALDHPGWYIAVLLGYVSSFVFFDRALRGGVPLGVAYCMWGAFGVALTAALSAAIFREAITGTMLVGIALIIAGVVCIELGRKITANQNAHGS
jgi:small multidrug resistance pump